MNHTGLDWVIPIADNVRGMGTSAFGLHYIIQCREAWKDIVEKSNFQKDLCACRTVHLSLNGEWMANLSINAMMIKKLCWKLEKLSKKSPSTLVNPLQTLHTFLLDLMDEVGPLFIVLDDIGDAVENWGFDDLDRSSMFMKFCHEIVGKWFTIKHVFFVLLVYSPFLSYIRKRPEDLHCNFTFSRLCINLLQSEAIQTIMKKTFIESQDRSPYRLCMDFSQALTRNIPAPRRPSDVLPEYFNPSQAFGMCNDVSFADITLKVPKIAVNAGHGCDIMSRMQSP